MSIGTKTNSSLDLNVMVCFKICILPLHRILYVGERNNSENFYNLQKELISDEVIKMHFRTARKSGNISHILKAFFVRHSSEYETSDSEGKVIQNLYSYKRMHMVR